MKNLRNIGLAGLLLASSYFCNDCTTSSIARIKEYQEKIQVRYEQIEQIERTESSYQK